MPPRAAAPAFCESHAAAPDTSPTSRAAHTAQHNMLEEFPVHERDVPRVQISAQKLEQWREVAFDEVSRVVSQRNSWYYQFQERAQDGYEQIADRDNLKAYARGVANSSHKNVLIRASLETTLDAIIYGLYCETTFEQRCSFAHLYEHHFLDGAVLHVGATRTRDDPFRFVGVKWVAFRSPAPALVASRDFIYFSYSGTTRDADGQRVLFRLLRSMPMDDVDVTERRGNTLVRGKISYLFLYRENGARTEVSALALHATAGSMPSWAVTKTISFVWPAILNLVTVAEAKLLVVNGVAAAAAHGRSLFATLSSSGSGSSSGFSRSKVSASAASCGVCFRRFRLMRSKRTCRGCMHFMCKSCTVKLCFLDERKEQSNTGVMALRFCLNCMVKARRERQELTACMLRDNLTATDLDDNFDALDVSIYRETLRTKYLDVLSDDEDDLDDLDIDIDDMDIDDANYSEPQFAAVATSSSPSVSSSSRVEKLKDEPNYSAGESFEGTSLMSSNPSLLSSTASFASSSVSSADGSLPFSLSSSHTSLLSYSSDMRLNSSRGASRSGARLRFGSSSSSLKRTASMTPQEADDLEQTFRLRMMLFPDEAGDGGASTTTSTNSSRGGAPLATRLRG